MGLLSLAHGGAIGLVPALPRSLVQRIAARVEARPEGVIRSFREDGAHAERSRGALWRRAGDIAAAVSGAGAGPGAFVVILADDILDVLPSVWACLRGGFVPVALMGAAREAAYRGGVAFERALSRLDKPVVIVDGAFAALGDRVPLSLAGPVVALHGVTPAAWHDAETTPEPAWLVGTSGSTGALKLVALSTDAVLFRNFAGGFEAGTPLPHALGTFPLDGVTGQHASFLHHDSWTQVPAQVLTARPAAILDAIEACAISFVTLTMSMVRGILAAEAGCGRTRRLGSLRLVGLGAEPLAAGLVQDFGALLERHGADPGLLIAGYGTTETGSLVAGSRALMTSGRAVPVCLGRPWHGVSMRVVNAAGAVVAAGEVGALELSCPAKMFTGYWGEPDATAAAFTADGWWRTGDLGQLVEGELTLRGRTKEVLILGGQKFSLADIDAEIEQVLGVDGVGYGYLIEAEDGEALGVAFDAGGRAGDVAAAIRAAVVRRFGIQPRQVTAVAAAAIPRTAVGKVRRGPLGALASCLPGMAVPLAAGVLARLGAIWREVLALDRDAVETDRFFDLGGDSLRAVTLDLQIGEAFGVRVPSEAFFAEPVFGNLVRLVQERLAGGGAIARAGAGPWPLPAALRQGLSSALEHWPGVRVGDMMGFHLEGDRPPLFWVFNVPDEAVRLAAALGPGQPLYAIRSGYQLSAYGEDEIQAFALRYVAEIERLRPSGPVFVAGNCQGGIIALAMGQHLLRRKRHVPLLVLMDWSFELQAYAGRVLLVAGRDNLHHNPRRLFGRPGLAWGRAFAVAEFEEISGGYAEGFQLGHVDALVRALLRQMRAALAAAPMLMPGSGYAATIRVDGAPATLRPGERHMVAVSVRNDGAVVWGATWASGVAVGSRWVGVAGAEFPQPRASLPQLGPGETGTVGLQVVAPRQCGVFGVVVDLVEDGNRWFGVAGAGFQLEVVAGTVRPLAGGASPVLVSQARPLPGTKSRRC